MVLSKIENYTETAVNQKILVAAVIIMLAAFASGATFATFNDTELTQNTFKAGQVDLQIAWQSIYNGNTVGESGFTNETPVFNLNDVKPGDNGSARIRIKIFDNPSTLHIRFNKTDDRDRTCIEPEAAVEVNCSPEADGELDQNLVKNAWIDDGDWVKEANETEVPLNESWTPVTTSGGLLRVFGTETKYLVLEWHLPHEVSNEVQTDTLEYSLALKAQQARHMDGVEDYQNDTGTGGNGDDNGTDPGDNNQTDPGDGNQTDNNTTDPGDGNETDPGDGNDGNQTNGGNQTGNETENGDTTDNFPVAEFTFDPNSPVTGENIQFNASDSTDDNQITSYEWDWTSDGTYDDAGISPQHSYGTDGDKNVTLRVTDNSSQQDTESKIISVASSSNGDDDNGDSDNDDSPTFSTTSSGGGGGGSSDAGTIRFNITDGQTPLSGITVTANDSRDTDDVSGNNGIALLNLQEGFYDFTFEGDGYQTDTQVFEVRERVTTTYAFEMDPTGEQDTDQLSDLLVLVEDENMTAIDNALVELNNSDTDTTNNAGIARFTLVPGAYQVDVSADGYQSGSDTVQIVEGEDSTLEIQLETIEQVSEGNTTTEGNTTDNGAPATGQFFGSPTGGAAIGFFLLLLLILLYLVYRRYAL